MSVDSVDLPRSVAAFLLEARGADAGFELMQSLADSVRRPDLAQSEMALVRRSEVGALAVALFGRSPEAVRAAFDRGGPPCVKAACLSNPFVSGAEGWCGTILGEQEAAEILYSGEREEIFALAANPVIPPVLVHMMCGRAGVAAKMPASATHWMVEGLLRNPALDDLFDVRMILPDGEDRRAAACALPLITQQLLTDGDRHDNVRRVIELLLRVRDGRTPLHGGGLDSWRALLAQWNADNASHVDPQTCGRMRMVLALYCASSADLQSLQADADPSLQAAFAGSIELTRAKDLESLRRWNEDAYFAGAPFNPALYGSRELGEVFAVSCGKQHQEALLVYVRRAQEHAERSQMYTASTRGDLDGAIRQALDRIQYLGAIDAKVVRATAALALGPAEDSSPPAPKGDLLVPMLILIIALLLVIAAVLATLVAAAPHPVA